MMNDRKDVDGVKPGPIGALGILDPSHDDESYWPRFRFRIMTRAADGLFLRRRAADVSVAGVVQGWSRTLAPIAALAAALAGFILFSDYRASNRPTDLEEALLAEVEDTRIPVADDGLPGVARFASEGF